ncbi:MAG TPA: class I SAM-dependent methyltransferase [Polyangiaceae bacterium]|nr:class I SAM-dependent methyltransferase [Polyangiaceae bacterium]
MSVDQTKLNEFMGKIVGDLGATMSSALLVLGDRLGLYKAMAAAGPVTSGELAKRSETSERYVREWLDAQAASGYVTYDPTNKRYTLPPEQAFALANDESPASVAGAFHMARAMWSALDVMEENFRTGHGLEWGHQHPCLFEGTERFFRAGYLGNLIGSWIPALDGVKAKLETGAKVADVGCGCGASTILMAQAFPRSKFHGFDYHQGSIDIAERRAREAGVSDRVTFSVAKSTDYPGTGYDLVAHFDCLHDMEDPAAAAKHTRRTLAKDGTWLVVEPFASDKAEENHNPVGRVFYSASTLLCVPHSLAHQGPGLGAQAGEARLRAVIVDQGGFTRLRRATQTPFNLILEARP